MALNFSLRKFPATGEVKGECGLPFGCIIQPFAQFDKIPLEANIRANVDNCARCSECYGYVNKYCIFERGGWVCSLCGNFNEYHSMVHNRYLRSQSRAQLTELGDALVELKCSAKSMLAEAEEAQSDEAEERLARIPEDMELVGRPVYVALVDLACGEDFLELVKSALLAALEALPPASLFGFVTFSEKIGLYDIQGALPVVKYVPLLANSKGRGGPTPLELRDAMALEDLLAPVGQYKDNLYSALEGLEVAGSELRSEGAAPPPVRRGFGGAVQAVLRYMSGLSESEEVGRLLSPEEISSVQGASSIPEGNSNKAPPPMMIGYSGARLLCFLSGPPNYGDGQVMRAKVPRAKTSDKDPNMQVDIQTMAMLGGDASFPINAALLPNSPEKIRRQPDDLDNQVSLDMGSLSLEDGGGKDPGAAGEVVVDPRGGIFYEDAAAAAAALGVAVDLYAISSEVLGLECLEPLASSSGGQLCWYSSVEDAALPQDVYRRLTGVQARNCRLRVRTSPEFKVQRCYGHLIPDQKYENLQHMVSCGPHDCVAYDFEFASSSGFISEEDCPPTLQLAFQYTVLLHGKASADAEMEAGADKNVWYRLERRIRIHTVQVAVAKTPKDLYSYADAEAILTLLTHKIVRASHEEGVAEARALMQDWLVILFAHYNLNMKTPNPDKVDMTFEACPALQPMARLVYVLLQSPLLLPGAGPSSLGKHHPDLRCYLENLWSALPPGDLLRAVYPVLSSWSTPDQMAYPKHSLSRTALVTAGEPIFLMDSFTHLIVYYVQGYPQGLPFPPPNSSKLRQTINQLRLNRIVAPQVKMLRGGVDDIGLFSSLLLEEADSASVQAGGDHLGTFVQFLDLVKGEVVAFLQAQQPQ